MDRHIPASEGLKTMTTTSAAPGPTAVDIEAAVEQLSGRLFTSAVGALELYTVQLGTTLGLYRAMAGTDGLTSAELAVATGCDERYVREWAQSQLVCGFLSADGTDVTTARFGLAPGAGEVLLDEVSPAYLAPLGQALASL